VQIILVRHGATDWNLQGRCQGSSDRHLSEVGIRQAEQIAERLRVEGIAAVYSSGLRRARETAEHISRPHNLPVLIEDAVRELDHGDLEGLTFNEIKSSHSDFLVRWRSEPAEISVPGGERLADVAERAWEGLHRIALRHADPEQIVTGTHLNDYRTFHLDPCGVTRLAFDGSAWALTEVNSREYPFAADTAPIR
jgi:broad specificity phosphatase PhoE